MERPLGEVLARFTREGELYRRLAGNKLQCFACGHRCVIPEGREGICKVRYNEGGRLRVPFGYVGAHQVDPIEKKPFFHALPGSLAMSFGMLGCDYRCTGCQNWYTSQALRDPAATAPPRRMTPQQIVDCALEAGAPVLTSTYNEPLITSEWAVAVFMEAKKHGLKCSYVSNGNGTPEVLKYIRPYVDFYKVDLKGFQDKFYRREVGGVLQVVLDTIPMLRDMGFWLEVVTLVIPGFNDSDQELKSTAKFLAGVSPDIPWHVTAFHKDYKMTDPENTPPETLIRAAKIGQDAGLHFVYAGNLPGKVGDFENTYCPGCRALLIERRGYEILQNRIAKSRCPLCHASIPGVWEAK